MSTQYPRSPNVQVGGIAHLGRIIDKIRLRHAGQIQDYNYLTVGFDRYLLDFLELETFAFVNRGRPFNPDRRLHFLSGLEKPREIESGPVLNLC